MSIEKIVMPNVGESVTNGVIRSVTEKTHVITDEIVAIADTDKISVEIPATKSGKVELLCKVGDQVAIGAAVANIDTSEAEIAESKAKEEKKAIQSESTKQKQTSQGSRQSGISEIPLDLQRLMMAHSSSLETAISPAVQELIAQSGIDPVEIMGTGYGGRVTHEDILNFQSNVYGYENPSIKIEGGASNASRTIETIKESIKIKNIQGFQKVLPQLTLPLIIKAIAIARALNEEVSSHISNDGQERIFNKTHDIAIGFEYKLAYITPMVSSRPSILRIAEEIAGIRNAKQNEKNIENLGSGFTVLHLGKPINTITYKQHSIAIAINKSFDDILSETCDNIEITVLYDSHSLENSYVMKFMQKTKELLENPELMLIQI